MALKDFPPIFRLSPTQSAFALGSIFSFRMIGLFMILPVFSLYAPHLPGANAISIGIALGIYGLLQAALQIPFGMLSDRMGRKPIITIGLILFAIGSVVAALSHSMLGIIIGRALQGSGAVGSTIMALVADITPEIERARAMAIIGLCIGLAFSLAILLGPFLASFGGLTLIFTVTACLAVLGIVIVYTLVPTPTLLLQTDTSWGALKKLLSCTELLRLDIGILILHAILTSTFLVVPIILQRSHLVELTEQWQFYLPLLVLSFLMMLPFIFLTEKKGQVKKIFLIAIIVIAMSEFILSFTYDYPILFMLILLFYFTAFNFLEASLPSLIAKIAEPAAKGAAMGVYSCSQFFGIFVGGILSGLVVKYAGISGVFLFNAVLALGWYGVAFQMQELSLKKR